ncbi:hypothetical protein VM1G_11772 [Cytospora mali]|uniref:Uncharacterized protein n=1 Tax=Cytospora mali TaxID=578113 RepID=A0A194W531_CYTMA|nr:hypothetical protein VM1G_11772 [Valsa mali]
MFLRIHRSRRASPHFVKSNDLFEPPNYVGLADAERELQSLDAAQRRDKPIKVYISHVIPCDLSSHNGSHAEHFPTGPRSKARDESSSLLRIVMLYSDWLVPQNYIGIGAAQRLGNV